MRISKNGKLTGNLEKCQRIQYEKVARAYRGIYPALVTIDEDGIYHIEPLLNHDGFKPNGVVVNRADRDDHIKLTPPTGE